MTSDEDYHIKRVQTAWTQPMCDRVKVKWIGGLSITIIAADISLEFKTLVTRNAIVGLVRRRGWDKTWPREAPKAITEGRARKARDAAHPKDVPNAREPKPRNEYAKQRFIPMSPKYGECIPEDVQIPPGQGTYPEHWLCQWPQVKPTDALRCTEPRVEGRPYCTVHCRRALTQIGNPNPYNNGFVKWATRGDGR